jgi:Flp pilus assembly protein TadG
MQSVSLRRQQGAVIITACFFLLFLLGFMAFALDLSRLFVVKTELQTAMDSCALAAAQELDGTATSITRATSAGMTAGNLNNVNLQSATWDDKGQITAADISFRDAAYLATVNGPSARYVECNHSQPGVRLWLLQAMGAFFADPASFPATQDVVASAVATRGNSQTSCPVPLALRPKVAGSGPPNYGYTPGEWITLLMGAGGGTNGYIGWANLDGSSNAAETERELLQGQCDVRVDEPLGTPGVQASIADAWNARFGIYRNAAGPADLYLQPDTTGYAYTSTNWPSSSAAYNGATPAGADVTAAPYSAKQLAFASCADTTTRMTGPNSCSSIMGRSVGGGFNKIAPPGAAAADGHAQWGVFNRRVVTVPITDTYPGRVQDYACMLMLQPMSIPLAPVQLEFIGRAGEAGVPCTTSGLPGSSVGPLVPVLVR